MLALFLADASPPLSPLHPATAWLILNVASVAAAAAASKSELARSLPLAGPKFIIIRAAAAAALRFGLVQYGRKRG